MKTTNYISNLTPLRGIAALLTVIFHIDLQFGNGGGLLLRLQDSKMINKMYLMVDLFFILSGFIMFHVYGTWFEKGVNTTDFKKFTIARFARVYPLHLFTLCYTIVLFSITGRLGIPEVPVIQIENSIFSIFTNLFLLQSMNFHKWFSWVHASWSISTEWWMYILFPFLVVPFAKFNPLGRAIATAACVLGYAIITVWLIPLVTFPPEIPFVKPIVADLTINVGYQYGFFRCLFGFVIGMMIYKSYQSNFLKKYLSNGYSLLLLVFGFLLCLHFAIPDIFSVLFLPFIILSVAYGSQGINKILNTAILQKIGDWSFSIYLVHQPVFYTLGAFIFYFKIPLQFDIFAAWMSAFVLIGLVLLVSYLTYRFVEVPARHWLNPRFSSN